ncbi:hypothetical protein FJZ36_07565 [Candidatus Poribacteria bacterium]|nr:hypothetical protein [Candidatus Poribacteria bacterium]
MFASLIDDTAAFLLSHLPQDVVSHFATARREALRGIRACVDACISDKIARIDRVEAQASKRRDSGATDRSAGPKMTIEEDEPTESS